MWHLNQRLGCPRPCPPHGQMSSLTSTPAPCLPGSSHHLVATGDSRQRGSHKEDLGARRGGGPKVQPQRGLQQKQLPPDQTHTGHQAVLSHTV